MSNSIVVGVTGATGQLFGSTALELLADREGIETHLVLSEAAKVTIEHESTDGVAALRSLADHVHDCRNVGAPIASGSFRTQGMLIAPCSMKTLANIATGNAGNLITRAADVTLKERRPLVVMPREKPYNRIHLENMLTVTDAGAVVFPPLLSFYQSERSLEAMVERTMCRALEHLGIEVSYEEWSGVTDGS
jgi:4-hydroxy-3-polyprenylbenzoate decarboxylase